MKRIFLLLAAVLLLTLALPANATGSHPSHPACGEVCTHEEACDTCDWDLMPNSGRTLSSGSYYLNEHVRFYNDLTVKSGETVRICFNGSRLLFDRNCTFHIQKGATVEFCDCTGLGGLWRLYHYSNSDCSVIYNEGTLIIYSGEYCMAGKGVSLDNKGELSIYDGTFGITLNNNGNATIYNASFDTQFSQNEDSLFNGEDGTLTVYDGTYTASGSTLDNMGTATIEGGTFQTISKSTANANECVYNRGGRLTIKDGSFTASNGHAVSNEIYFYYYNNSQRTRSSSITVRGGTFVSPENYAALYNTSGATVYGGNFSGYIGLKNDSHFTDENSNGGDCEIYGGTFTGTYCGVLNSGNSWTTYTSGSPVRKFSRATLQLGNSPSISKLILQYPDSLTFRFMDVTVDLEIDLTDFSVGDTVYPNKENMHFMNLLNEGYHLLYDNQGYNTVLANDHCGKEGANLRWDLTPEGVLTISGEGEMEHFGFSSYQPWNHSKTGVDITEIVIENGVTSIGEASFSYLDKLTKITIPESVTHIHSYCFEGYTSLKEINLPKSLAYIGNAFAIHGNPTAKLNYAGCIHMWELVEQSNNNSFTVNCAPFVIQDDGDCTTGQTCSICAVELAPGRPAHTGGTASCTEKAKCTECGMAYGDPLGHKWQDAACEKAKTCSVCGKTDGTPLGHKWDAATCETAKTCSACGKMEGAPNGHVWMQANCENPKTCETCGKTEGAALGHKWADATCETPKTCSFCGKTEGEAKGHKWGAASCEKAKTCSVCNQTEGTALSHKWSSATCENPKTCERCGKPEGSALGHKWKNASCEKPKTCERCGKTEGAALGHKWTEATCETAKLCSACGKTEGTPKGHNWNAATCDKAKTCTVCGISEGTAVGHKWVEASCERPGTCARCGKTEGAALGHHWNAATCERAKTCSVCGKTEGSPNGHNWNAATCDTPKICTVCATAEGSPKGHNWNAASCEKPKTCSVCKKSEGAVAGHKWDNGIVTKEPTEQTEGVKTYKCTACGETRTEAIPVLSHTHKYEQKVTGPTCTEKGYTTHICSCGYSYTDSETAPLGHKWDKGTVTKEPTEQTEGVKTYKCTACAETKTESIPVLSHTHKYEQKVTAPTCTEKGYTTHTCPCGHSYTDSETAPLGHKWDKGTVTKEPTEQTEGVKTYKCTACGKTRTEAIPVLSHTHKYEQKVTVPTCTEKGYTTHTCPCGYSYTGRETAPLDHKWDNGAVTKEPGKDDPGEKTFTCTACGQIKTESIPSLLHPFEKMDKKDTVTGQFHVSLLDSGEKITFSYEIPEDGVAVLIFFSTEWESSQTLMRMLNSASWLRNPWLKMVAIASNVDSRQNLKTYCETYTPDVMDQIQYLFSGDSALLEAYQHQLAIKGNQESPLVLVVGESDHGPIIRYSSVETECCEMLPEAIANVSETFAQWDGTEHIHNWVDATCEAPKTCADCGGTEGEALGHDFRDGECARCGLGEIMPGDANGDRIVNYQDAMLVLRCSIGLEELSDAVRAACNVNGDNKLDYQDAMQILRFSIGLITEFSPKAK